MIMMSWVIVLREMRSLKLNPHHLPIQKIWRVEVPMNLVCQNAQTPQTVQRDQIWSAVCLNWVMDVLGWNMSAGAIGLMTGDVMIACSQGNAHLLGEVISMKHPTVLLLLSFCSWETLESSGPVDGSHGDGWHGGLRR